jgi:hypothetical protein
VVGVRRDQHRHEIVIQSGRHEPKLDGTCGHVTRRVGIAGPGVLVEATQKFIDAHAILRPWLDNEGEIDILPLDISLSPRR